MGSVRGVDIKRKAWGVSPRIGSAKRSEPAERAAAHHLDECRARAFTRFAGSIDALALLPGAHAPGFTLMSAPRTAYFAARRLKVFTLRKVVAAPNVFSSNVPESGESANGVWHNQ